MELQKWVRRIYCKRDAYPCIFSSVTLRTDEF